MGQWCWKPWSDRVLIPYVWIKGLIMERCVLLTSTPVCCLVPRRDNTRGVDVNNTHLSMIDPDYNMMPKILLFIYQYSVQWNQIKAWIESNHSPCCHVTTQSWWQVSLSPPPPVAKVYASVFFWKQNVLIELRQSGVIACRQRSRSCGEFKSWISVSQCPLQRKWWVLHNYDISVLEQVGMFFHGIVYLMKV